VTATLEADRSNKSLDFGGLGVRLGILLLGARNLSPDHILPHIILLRQVVQLPDLGRPLWAKPLGKWVVGEAWDIVVALLDDDQGKDSNIGPNDAATDGFALALTLAAGPVAGVAVGEKEFDAIGEENTLFHGETLLVISAGDTEDIAFPLIAYGVGRNLLCDFLIIEDAVSLFVVEIKEFLSPSSGVGDV
jgi:hypothetical protein